MAEDKRTSRKGNNIEYAKVPPQAVDLERYVIGSLLIDKDAFDLVSDRLKPESFYDPRNQIVYSVIQDMVLNNKPVDIATVAEELNITRAAEKLHISQPPLSAQIKSLETELDTVLFFRGKRRLKLTESGQLLYRRAKEIIKLTDKTKSEILSLGEGMRGTIAIGLVEGMAPDIAAEWFAGFRAIHPNVRFRILDGSTDDLLEKLRTGLISLAVITSPCDNSLLHSFHVGEEKMAALMNRHHPLAQDNGRKVRVADLVGENLIVPSRKALIETIYRWSCVQRDRG